MNLIDYIASGLFMYDVREELKRRQTPQPEADTALAYIGAAAWEFNSMPVANRKFLINALQPMLEAAETAGKMRAEALTEGEA